MDLILLTKKIENKYRPENPAEVIKSLIKQIKTTSYFGFKHLLKLYVRLSSIGVENFD